MIMEFSPILYFLYQACDKIQEILHSLFNNKRKKNLNGSAKLVSEIPDIILIISFFHYKITFLIKVKILGIKILYPQLPKFSAIMIFFHLFQEFFLSLDMLFKVFAVYYRTLRRCEKIIIGGIFRIHCRAYGGKPRVINRSGRKPAILVCIIRIIQRNVIKA